MPLTQIQSGMIESVAQYYGFKNRIINGAMVINQRNAGAAVTATNSFPVDRFYVANGTDGAFSAQQDSSAPVGFVNSVKITITTADATLTTSQNIQFSQRIEGTSVADLAWGTANANTVTLSFWVRSSLTGTFGGSLKNSANDRSYPFSYSISAANTWEQKSINIAGDTTGTWATNTGVGIQVIFSLGAGPDRSGTAGAWAAGNFVSATGATSVVGTNGATFYITGVQLEKGSTATSFDYRPYGTELQLCQRYYENNYPTGTAVGTALGDNVAYGFSYRSGTATPYFGMLMQQRKRATPTFTAYNGVTGASGTWRGSGSVNETTTISGNEVSFTAVTSATDSLIRAAFYTADSEL